MQIYRHCLDNVVPKFRQCVNIHRILLTFLNFAKNRTKENGRVTGAIAGVKV